MFLVSLQAALPCQTLVWWLHNVHREPSQTDGQATSSFFWDIAWLWPLNVVPIPCSKIFLAVCSDHRNWHIVKYGQTPCCWKFFELKMYWTDAGLQGLHYSYHFLNWKCIGQTLAYWDFITAIIFWIGNVLDGRLRTGTSLQLLFTQSLVDITSFTGIWNSVTLLFSWRNVPDMGISLRRGPFMGISLCRGPFMGNSLRRGPFMSEGNLESGGGSRVPGTSKGEWRRALVTGHLSATDSVKGTLRDSSFTGDPERYVKQTLEMGICSHRSPAFGEHGGALLSGGLLI